MAESTEHWLITTAQGLGSGDRHSYHTFATKEHPAVWMARWDASSEAMPSWRPVAIVFAMPITAAQAKKLG